MAQKTIPVFTPHLEASAAANVQACLESGWISSEGVFIDQFERAWAEKCNVRHGIAVNSGTSALEIAMAALELDNGAEVILPSYTIISCASAILNAGYKIRLVDVDPDTWCINVEQVAEKIGEKTRAIMPVHMFGHPADMAKIMDLANRYNLNVVEDAAEAHAASFNNKIVGGIGDIGCFSFYANKIITTGEGGMAVTNNKQIYEKLDILKNHGITRNQLNLKRKKLEFWYYEQQFLGFNYRLSDISAALGISQLKRLNKFILERNKIAKRYDLLLKNLPVKPQEIKKGNKSSFHLYIILLELKKIKKSYNQIFTALRNKGIMINLHYLPVHLQPFYKKFGFKNGSFPVSENYAKQAISLPIYPGLTKVEQIKIVKILKKITS